MKKNVREIDETSDAIRRVIISRYIFRKWHMIKETIKYTFNFREIDKAVAADNVRLRSDFLRDAK